MSRRLCAVAVSVLVGALLVAAPAQAADTCAYDSGAVTITSDAGETSYLEMYRDGDDLSFHRADESGTVTPVNCGSTTVDNVSSVLFSMSHPSFAALVLSMAGGTFNPAGATSAIDISIDQTAPAAGGSIAVLGTFATPSRITAGSDGIDLDGDDAVDVTYLGASYLDISSWDHDDVLSAAGSSGTGGALGRPVFLRGRGGTDVIRGGTADDALAGGEGNDSLYGGGGADALGAQSGMAGELEAGNDRLFGGAGIDRLGGGSGDDWLDGGTEADDLYGDAGIDTVSYAMATAAVRASIDGVVNDGTFAGGVSEGDQIRFTVENIRGSAFADRLDGRTGSANARNVLTGAEGRDSIKGLDGNDLLNGGDGNDALVGGTGINTFSGALGADTMTGGSSRDVMVGGPGWDTAYGGAGNDDLIGDGGNDRLFGQDGNDDLDGGAGTDECRGGIGTNVFVQCETP